MILFRDTFDPMLSTIFGDADCWCNEDVANEDGLPKANAARTNLPVQPVSNSFHSLQIAATVAVDATAAARFIVDEWMCSGFLGEAARSLQQHQNYNLW